jgi:prepilin-type N-terminal cleavage/methylation domain-containing protein
LGKLFILPMKTRPTTLRGALAFTLIELVTVIAIIAILMGLLFPVFAMAREAARRTKAATVVKSITSACRGYATDYGKFPPIDGALVTTGTGSGGENTEANSFYSYGDTETAKCKVPNHQLFDVLRGIARGPNANHALNLRRQSYFEDNTGTDPKNPRDGFADGKGFPEGMQGQLLDPWGKQYCIVLDADQDGLLDLREFFRDLTDPIRNSAVAFAMAKDGRIGGKGYEGRFRKEGSNETPDDIVSW